MANQDINIAVINNILAEIAQQSVEEKIDLLVQEMDEEIEALMYASDPRSHGPDFDEDYEYVGF
jgi:hypothetical protein